MTAVLRSLLFVPAGRERMLEHALTARADALVLDLEDAVPARQKGAARALARRWIPRLAKKSRPVFVRVNGLRGGLTRDDLLSVVSKQLAGVVLPKTESPQDLRDIDVLLREAELAAGVRPGDVRTGQASNTRPRSAMTVARSSRRKQIWLSLGSKTPSWPRSALSTTALRLAR